MSMTSKFMSRRAVLGGTLAAAALPLVAQGQDERGPAEPEATSVRIRIGFNNLTLTATLADNPTARDLVSMLPLNLKIEDYGRNEKIVHLPRKLTEEGSGAFGNEQPGDLCYFKPWGNLALFYADYRWDGLIRLGRFDNDFEPLRVRGEYPLRIERI
ncbi:cyclophilin-like fold protein (plasmid) [Rhizobium leguminosarum]|uniref:cyclophilin-like fold protein n=1 Tax=Rhizobium leguminosarum TaxID=384 RepID=UPI001C954A3C|nr:cyclophilin-like fold protein [Rhizobium leguminosarum]MBY5901413.1 MFS transporter [Rhizobium leguminosarum]MBY5908057.1 MFS transporter [Rhizobium leguminosarum]